MTSEDELIQLRQEHADVREHVKRIPEREESVRQLREQVQSLQERLVKESHNSHVPPSSDRFARQKKTRSQRTRSGKKPGGQVGHNGHHLALSATPSETIVHPVERCSSCQADLRAIAVRTIERRQVVDVPPVRLPITEHQAERTCCPHGHAETRASFPSEIQAPVQYGTGLGALAVSLVTSHLLPFTRAAEILSDLLAVHKSEGTIRHLCGRCGSRLRPIERQIKIALRQSPVIHQDESGLSVAGKRIWMHVTSTNTRTHSQVHAKCGTEALDANGMLPG
jgi:transposase